MLFNSYTFILFFLIVLVLYYVPFFKWRIRKFHLLIASYIFYAAWNPPFVILIWISTLVDWYVGKWLAAGKGIRVRRRLLFFSLAVNLGLLSFFKYSQFLLDNFIGLLDMFNIQFTPALPDIILPVGISFYTFQTLSYTLDIYRGKCEPWNSFLDYALYVTFFPQLVAGPIVRSVDFLPQTRTPKKADADRLGWGFSLIGLGLFQKIVIADAFLAPVVEKVFDNRMMPDMISAWVGTAAFSGQIFSDFAGYSTCAVGVALCLGFILPENFNYPYAALNLSDFWRRWHISLSTWLRDYLFLPIAYTVTRSRITPLRFKKKPEAWGYLVGISITMFLGGLWHGAGWTFVAWGVIHGIYLVIGHTTRKARKKIRDKLKLNKYVRLHTFLKITTTFTLVSLAWVFFRSHSFEQACIILVTMLGFSFPGVTPRFHLNGIDIGTSVFIITGMLIIHWLMRERSLKALVENMHWVLRPVFLAGILLALLFLSGEDNAFIYFQF
jgi:alginate O-acetyltransferase complex protein AlgI